MEYLEEAMIYLEKARHQAKSVGEEAILGTIYMNILSFTPFR